MFIKKISVKNFRCFKDLQIDFSSQIVLITGENGAGKTSLLEALHYICYMKSFRTSNPKEMLNFCRPPVNQVNMVDKIDDEVHSSDFSDNFFIKANFLSQDSENELQVGFSDEKRLVKLNKKNISSFNDLLEFYRVITVFEDDMMIVKGGPEYRRDFLDHAILLENPSFLEKLREFKRVLQNRNSLLRDAQINGLKKDIYAIWTEQLWEKSIIIQKMRELLIKDYEKRANEALSQIFTSFGESDDLIELSLEYKPKSVQLEDNFESFLSKNNGLQDLMEKEIKFSRSLFGAHLDDFLIKFQSKKSRNYASRGQQKLIILMLKVAQILNLKASRGASIFLLDDFMTDFDQKRGEILLNFLASLKIQLIFTCPSSGSIFENVLFDKDFCKISLPI